MVMEGKDNQYDPAELFKQWLEKQSALLLQIKVTQKKS